MTGPSRAWAFLLATLLLAPVAAVGLPVEAPLDLSLEAAPASAEADWTFDDRVVVGFRSATVPDALAALAASMGGRLVRVDATLDFAVLEVDPARQHDLLKAAYRIPGVAYAKPDMRMEGFFTPNDPRYADQWGPATMAMESAWDMTRGSHNVTVAILDTGVQKTHPDLAANYCVDGPDYSNLDSDPADDHGHGTHVAGTVAAAIDNGVGVAGMADACLMGVKVLNAWGSGSFADLASALVWSADNGADVISMSLGGCPGCDPGSPTTEAMQYAYDAGVLIVAAAGNAWCSPVSYPAAYPEAIAVAALTAPGTDRASFSSCGEKVELSAPGDNVLSTSLSNGEPLSDPSGYMYLSGTSMATPHVSGVAALVWADRPTLTNADLRCVLAQTATDLGDLGRDEGTGFGRVDAAAAMSANCVPQPPTPVTLSGRARDERVQLKWTPATSWGSNLSGYNVYRGASGSNLTLLASLGDVREFVDENVTNNVTYSYAVAGVNAMGEGAWSNVLDLTPSTPPPFSCDATNDTFGNTCEPTTLDFIDVQLTGTPLPAADDALFNVALPFPFTFYGRQYSSFNVSTNGFLNFFDGTSSGCCSPSPIPSTEGVNAFVAGMWADLLPIHERAITTQTVGLPGERIMVVQFTDVPFYGGAEGAMTFQFQLHEATGAVEVHYLDADPLEERTYAAGIEDCTGSDGIQAKFGMAALVDTAVRYLPGSGTPPSCHPNTPPVVTILTPAPGETVSGEVTATGTAYDNDTGDQVEYLYGYYYNQTHTFWLPIEGIENWSATFTTDGLEGTYTLVVYAYDGTTYSYGTYVDFVVGNATQPRPRAVIHSPADGSTVRGVTQVWGNATPAGDTPIDYVTLQVDSSAEFIVNGTTSWNATVDFRSYSPGWYTLRTRAHDANGAGPAHEVQVYVEARNNTAPSANISWPFDGATVGRWLSVYGSAYDPDAGDFVQAVFVSVDGGPEHLAWGAESWFASIDLLPYGEGMHVVSVRAFDGEAFGPTTSVTVFADFPEVDLAIEAIEVERQRIMTDFGDAPNVVNERRTVSVTVRNLGNETNWWASLSLVVHGETSMPLVGSWQTIGWGDVPPLAPGEAATVTFEWDTTTTVGDVTLIASVWSPDDMNGRNDRATEKSWVRVGGINAGVTV